MVDTWRPLIDPQHAEDALECAPSFMEKLRGVAKEAVEALGMGAGGGGGDVRIPAIISGAGHDAMAMGQLTQVGVGE